MKQSTKPKKTQLWFLPPLAATQQDKVRQKILMVLAQKILVHADHLEDLHMGVNHRVVLLQHVTDLEKLAHHPEMTIATRKTERRRRIVRKGSDRIREMTTAMKMTQMKTQTKMKSEIEKAIK